MAGPDSFDSAKGYTVDPRLFFKYVKHLWGHQSNFVPAGLYVKKQRNKFHGPRPRDLLTYRGCEKHHFHFVILSEQRGDYQHVSTVQRLKWTWAHVFSVGFDFRSTAESQRGANFKAPVGRSFFAFHDVSAISGAALILEKVGSWGGASTAFRNKIMKFIDNATSFLPHLDLHCRVKSQSQGQVEMHKRPNRMS